MNLHDAQKLGTQIMRDDPQVTVTGRRNYGRGSWGLDCVDNRTGYPFVIDNPEQWEERKRAAAFDLETADAYEPL